MAKIITLKDHKTNELAYPQTVSDAVYMDNGSTLEQYKESVSRQFANYPNVTVTGTVTNLPDNEDIRETEQHTLQLADRNNLEGMGYAILRKNKSFAEQVIYENTIYEIRYYFDLNDGSVTIPAGCVLKFLGGTVSNGTVAGQGTIISASGQRGVFDSVDISGDWNNPVAFPEWFAGSQNEKKIINAILVADTVQIDEDYLLDSEIHIEKPVHLFGDGKLTFSENVGGGADLSTCGCLYIESSKVSITGLTFKSNNPGDTNIMGASIINIFGNSTNKLSHINIENCTFDGGEYAINADYCLDSNFKYNTIKNVTSNGIALHSSEKALIEGNNVNDINSDHLRNVSYGIAITYHTGENPSSKNVICVNNAITNNLYWEGIDTHGGKDIIIANNICKNCYVGIAAVSNDTTRIIKNIIISDNYIEAGEIELSSGIRAAGYISTNTQVVGENVKICDNIITGNPVSGIYGGCIENYQVSNNQIEALDQGIHTYWLSDKIKINDNVISLNYGEETSQMYRCGIFFSRGITGSAGRTVYVNNNLICSKDSCGTVAEQNFNNFGIGIHCKNNNTRTTNNDKYRGGITETNNITFFSTIDEDCFTFKKVATPGSIAAGTVKKVAECTVEGDNIPSYWKMLVYTVYCNRGIQQMILSENHNGTSLDIYLYNPTAAAISLAESDFTICGKYIK